MIWIIIALSTLLSIASFIAFKLIKRELNKVYIPFDSSYDSSELIYISCTCSGKNLCFIVDSGCNATTIKQETLDRLPHKKHRRKNINYEVVGDAFEGILRCIDIQIAEHHFEIFCYTIANNCNIAKGIDGLLGSDFLSKHGWCIDYKQKCLIINK